MKHRKLISFCIAVFGTVFFSASAFAQAITMDGPKREPGCYVIGSESPYRKIAADAHFDCAKKMKDASGPNRPDVPSIHDLGKAEPFEEFRGRWALVAYSLHWLDEFDSTKINKHFGQFKEIVFTPDDRVFIGPANASTEVKLEKIWVPEKYGFSHQTPVVFTEKHYTWDLWKCEKEGDIYRNVQSDCLIIKGSLPGAGSSFDGNFLFRRISDVAEAPQ